MKKEAEGSYKKVQISAVYLVGEIVEIDRSINCLSAL